MWKDSLQLELPTLFLSEDDGVWFLFCSSFGSRLILRYEPQKVWEIKLHLGDIFCIEKTEVRGMQLGIIFAKGSFAYSGFERYSAPSLKSPFLKLSFGIRPKGGLEFQFTNFILSILFNFDSSLLLIVYFENYIFDQSWATKFCWKFTFQDCQCLKLRFLKWTV